METPFDIYCQGPMSSFRKRRWNSAVIESRIGLRYQWRRKVTRGAALYGITIASSCA
jgi:hypothetical protein